MPELPEVETVARTLYPHIHNCVFENSSLLLKSTLHPLSLPLSTLTGCRIKNVRRRAKLLIIDLDKTSPLYLVAHLRMTGRLFTAKANVEQGKHTRCVFGLRKPDGSSFQLFFDDTRTFGKLLIAGDAILDKWKFWRELGPEPLEIGSDILASRLKSARALKAALLDQKVIAGIGNIYADEALFQARLSPLRPANSLNNGETARLLGAIQDVLRRSISQCGSSIRDYRDADGNVGAFQNTFMVYGRGGEKCKKCGALLHKTKIGGRATVSCPHCQK